MGQPLIEPDQINLSIGFRLLPTGAIVPFGGNVAPSGFLLCDGSAVSRTTYATLFAVLQETYGAGDSVTTFNLPDLRGNVPVGINGGTFASLGTTVGAEIHTLTTSETPSHNHSGSTANNSGSHTHTGSTDTHPGHTHTLDQPHGGTGGTGTYGTTSGNGAVTLSTDSAGSHSHAVTINSGGVHSHGLTITSVGSNQPHNNIQPSMVLNFIIAT